MKWYIYDQISYYYTRRFFMIYKTTDPYPIPRVTGENPYYAHLLMQDYAGEVSEDSAIHLYLYQFLTQNKKYQDIANALHHIAEVEMRHLQLLGETIKLLGVDPIFGTKDVNEDKFIPWSAGYVSYDKEIHRILEIDIRSETSAIRNYRLHREMINDPYIKVLLTRIIEDEKIHLDIFHEFQRKLNTKN